VAAHYRQRRVFLESWIGLGLSAEEKGRSTAVPGNPGKRAEGTEARVVGRPMSRVHGSRTPRNATWRCEWPFRWEKKGESPHRVQNAERVILSAGIPNATALRARTALRSTGVGAPGSSKPRAV